jgi:hypothetical protein
MHVNKLNQMRQTSKYTSSNHNKKYILSSDGYYNDNCSVIQTCGAQYCLVPHILVYKAKHQPWVTSTAPNESTASQSGVSDVTPELVLSLENCWDDYEKMM